MRGGQTEDRRGRRREMRNNKGRVRKLPIIRAFCPHSGPKDIGINSV